MYRRHLSGAEYSWKERRDLATFSRHSLLEARLTMQCFTSRVCTNSNTSYQLTNRVSVERKRKLSMPFAWRVKLTTHSPENVFLFVPNLIGYARIITAAAALIIMPKYPRVCTMVYFVSCMLDVADGQAARKLGQTSKFGAVLDMVTDRFVLPSPFGKWNCYMLVHADWV